MRGPNIFYSLVISALVVNSSIAHAQVIVADASSKLASSGSDFQTYAMILVGVGLIGLSARRRK